MSNKNKGLFFLAFILFWFSALYFPVGLIIITVIEVIARFTETKQEAPSVYKKENMSLPLDILLYGVTLCLLVVGWFRFTELGDHYLYPYAFVCTLLMMVLDFRTRWSITKFGSAKII